jgi:hypothetical protein
LARLEQLSEEPTPEFNAVNLNHVSISVFNNRSLVQDFGLCQGLRLCRQLGQHLIRRGAFERTYEPLQLSEVDTESDVGKHLHASLIVKPSPKGCRMRAKPLFRVASPSFDEREDR